MISRVGLFFIVEISGMYSGLTGRSAKISAGFMILGELTMELGQKILNSVGAIEKYNQLLKPK